MLVLVGILCVGAWYGWTGLSADRDIQAEPEATPSPACSTPEPVTARARNTLVSVYNAGAPTGTGGLVMDALNARGFDRGEIANAPRGITVRGVVVWTDRPDSAAARLVARQLRQAKIRERANIPGPGVNIFYGTEFTGLRKAPRKLTVRPEARC
ncbi:MAG TPA: LytR C-terminal domain-containing protein [Nocardioidaceae bacterium]|nr:LytR C-terminal domain-containing protein [Nocardioidaceae bacterium]